MLWPGVAARRRPQEKEIPNSLPQYDRLLKSLSSGLPNEVDFSLNACVLMSVRGPYALKLDGHPNLITLIVAQAGVFDDESSFLQTQFAKLQSRLDRDFEHFWSGVGIEDADVLKLFPVKSTKYSKIDYDQFPSIRDVGQTQKSLQVVRSRVLQVSDIIRNLAFEPDNRPFITSNWASFKFLLASIASDDYELRNNALDTISELASHITFTTEILTRGFLRLLRSFFFADDRFLVMRSTEILGRLCVNSENEPAMYEFLDSSILHRLFDLVSAKDVLISVTTLDALYNMSESGSDFCEKLAEVPHAVELLFDFCTIEASQFFTEGLSGIKVIEYQASGQEHQVSQTIRQPIHHAAPFSTTQVQQRVQPQLMGPPVAPSSPVACIQVPSFMCEWNACTQYFQNGAAMIYHILNAHIEGKDRESTPTKNTEEAPTQPKYPPGALIYCLWPGCERTPRSKWSLITHLQDHHCNENALNSAARKRRELGDSNYVARIKQTLNLETPPANHAGYSNFAAYEAIRRHAFQFMTRDLTEDHPEGPVTKDLRLTSALILRNLARHSAECRKRLRPYEGFMAYMAMSRLENGAALAQCLATLSTVEIS